MKYIAAYLLAQAGGDAAPSKAKVTSILESVGIQVDSAALDALLAKLDGKDIAELIKEGSSKLAVVGGGAAAPAAGGAAPAEEKKEEKKEEEEVVELAGGFDDLFG
ncbi:60S acidic ribosomal protein P2 [Tritrichomonas foetus]|uniref:60S acidic ribosomal protein P2 n=1 Tax=Tritrichomonas foetus TaxID=1144522 RepID=A0A1J4L0H8_9EUKA|nr:60S acidic ribosomal protein P2 [Tritrichomonas foetus]|eukprot:OHT17007.1 60S acidic ribosomal protein P2 [Tritrichomonas foetus]